MTVYSGRAAAWAARLFAVVTLAMLIVGLVLNGTGLFAGDGDYDVQVFQVVTFLPLICYCVAIWLIARAFGALARGEAAEMIVARLLVRVGACLFAGGVLRVFGEPWLIRLILDRPWPFANFDIAAVSLAFVGLLLILLSGPLREAARMRADLDGIL